MQHKHSRSLQDWALFLRRWRPEDTGAVQPLQHDVQAPCYKDCCRQGRANAPCRIGQTEAMQTADWQQVGKNKCQCQALCERAVAQLRSWQLSCNPGTFLAAITAVPAWPA